MIKAKGFEVMLQDGKTILRPRGSKFTGVVIGVKKHGIYRLTRNPINQGKKKVPNT